MRINFGSKPLNYPQPVFILATYDKDGVPNAINAAWGGISAGHKTTVNIIEHKAFTISVATAEQMVAEAG